MADPKPTTAPADEVEMAKGPPGAVVPGAYQDISDEFPAKKRKKMLLKMDVRIVPVLMLLYCKPKRLWSECFWAKADMIQCSRTSTEQISEMRRLRASRPIFRSVLSSIRLSCQSSSLATFSVVSALLESREPPDQRY